MDLEAFYFRGSVLLYVLCRANDLTAYFSPVNRCVKLLVDEANATHVVAAYEVEAQGYFCRRLVVIGRINDTLNSAYKDLKEVSIKVKAGI